MKHRPALITVADSQTVVLASERHRNGRKNETKKQNPLKKKKKKKDKFTKKRMFSAIDLTHNKTFSHACKRFTT